MRAPTVKPVAAIDCGTNSVRLLVVGADGGQITRQMRVVRLGQDVDRTGRLAPQALARTRAALQEYRALMEAAGVARVRMVTTSASRDAENRAEFTAMVHEVLGIDPEVVSGVEEARLSFHGAVGTSALSQTGEVLVTDVGGGSSEIVRGGPGGLRAHSMNVGCVRLTERHLHSDPPTAAQVAAARDDICAALADARREVALTGAAALVAVAGTVTTLAALALGLDEYDSSVIHSAILTRESVDELTEWLLRASHSERAARAVIHPGRVDVITAGALIIQQILLATGQSRLIVSESDILDGIAASIAESAV